MATSHLKPPFIGPHEGRELQLIKDGRKPLCMFVEPIPSEQELFPEQEFDSLVSEGKLIKHQTIETIELPNQQIGKLRRVLYAPVDEAWRIEALLMVNGLYNSLDGKRPDLERITGLLLGYSRDDIENYIAYHKM